MTKDVLRHGARLILPSLAGLLIGRLSVAVLLAAQYAAGWHLFNLMGTGLPLW